VKRLLLIEDDQYKLEKVKAFLEETYPDVSITIKTSFHGGFVEIADNFEQYSLVLLDMSMQNYDITQDEAGGDPAPLAGRSILTQMFLRDIPTKVIVITMFEHFQDGTRIKDLHSLLKEEFPDNYTGYVFFSHSDTKWKSDLKSEINKLL
jgi:DNA-binding NarL/FixJ family response regulator